MGVWGGMGWGKGGYRCECECVHVFICVYDCVRVCVYMRVCVEACTQRLCVYALVFMCFRRGGSHLLVILSFVPHNALR